MERTSAPNINYDEDGLENIASHEEQHFWFSVRKNYILKYFKKYVKKEYSILEIGSGTGYLAKALQNEGFNITASEYYQKGREITKKRGVNEVLDIDILSPEHDRKYDVICLFDVLEHFEERQKVIQNLRSLLSPQGLVILTVPAFNFLWSKEDDFAHHKIRYNPQILTKEFKRQSFTAVRVSFIFVTLLPLLLARKTFLSLKGKEKKLESSPSIQVSSLFSILMFNICNLEYHFHSIFRFFPGGSILAVFQKK